MIAAALLAVLPALAGAPDAEAPGPAPRAAQAETGTAEVGADPFAGVTVMDEAALREASGGSAVYGVAMADDALGALQTNQATSTVDLTGTVTGSTNGAVSGNAITGNSGITTVFVNTGNNVVMQSTVQVNVYTPMGQ